MEVLQLDGKTIQATTYDERTFEAVAAGPRAAGPGPVKPNWDQLISPPAAGARSCQGYATPCAQRGTYDCALGAGCFSGSGSCSGYPSLTCMGQPQAVCTSITGCMWLYNACSGMPSCAGYSNQYACQGVLGCQWQETCSGQAVDCTSLQELACAQQPGCFVR